MDEKNCLKVIKFHNLCCKLKKVIRTGWKVWHVEDDRVESIAEHVFGSCMLAVGIMSEIENCNLDENKVIAMIALHETEEILIGDITPYEDDKMKTKKECGKQAVAELFSNLDFSINFENLIKEFEEFKTPEAKFARMCDKLEAGLQAYMYEDKINYSKIDERILNNEIIQNAINNGAECVGDYFTFNDSQLFDQTFKDIAKVAKKYYTNK